MDIQLKEITIAELVKDYVDDPASGQVVGYGAGSLGAAHAVKELLYIKKKMQ